MTDPRNAPEASAEKNPTTETSAATTGQPDAGGAVQDAVMGNWVDRLAPPATRPYLRLSRADRPVGTWLLWIPCLWGALLARHAVGGGFDLALAWVIVATGFGAFLMRGAGCTWNDITDRHLDAQVARTRSRPLPSGQVSLRGAYIWMGLQALAGLCILLTLNTLAIILGFASIIPVLIYPFAKRFTWWPQVFLGIAFNWGALLAYAAVAGGLDIAAWCLYFGGMAWTLFYDTIYAHQDTEDDALIGVKSTARLFGDNSPRWLRRFLVTTCALIALAVITAPINNPLAIAVAFGGPWAMGWHMLWQLGRFDASDPAKCLGLFRANRETGLIVTLFFAVALMV